MRPQVLLCPCNPDKNSKEASVGNSRRKRLGVHKVSSFLAQMTVWLQDSSGTPLDIHAAVHEAVQEAVNASLIQNGSSSGVFDGRQGGTAQLDKQDKQALSTRITEDDATSGDENSRTADGNSSNLLEVPGQPNASLRLHKAQIRVRNRYPYTQSPIQICKHFTNL